MILYHGSRTKGIQTLEPRLADHDQPYIYLSTLEVVAALYLCNGVERPYYWFPYGFRKDDPNVPVYDELYPNGLPEVSEGISGCIYITDVPESQVLPFKNIPCARLSVQPIPVSGCIEVSNAHELLLEYERQGRLVINRYETLSERYLNFYYGMILDYIRKKEMYRTPECSYARFVRAKFPFVWERYIQGINGSFH